MRFPQKSHDWVSHKCFSAFVLFVWSWSVKVNIEVSPLRTPGRESWLFGHHSKRDIFISKDVHLFFSVAGQVNQCWTVSASSWHLESLDSSSRCWYALSSLQCPYLSWASRAYSFLVWIFTSSLLDKCSYVLDTLGCVGEGSSISLLIIALPMF